MLVQQFHQQKCLSLLVEVAVVDMLGVMVVLAVVVPVVLFIIQADH